MADFDPFIQKDKSARQRRETNMPDDPLSDIQQEVDKIQKTLAGLKAIENQLNKARSIIGYFTILATEN
jgi:hypothetical protein